MEICLATEPTWAACAVILDGDEIVPRNFSSMGARCFHRRQRITDRHRCMCLDGTSAFGTELCFATNARAATGCI